MILDKLSLQPVGSDGDNWQLLPIEEIFHIAKFSLDDSSQTKCDPRLPQPTSCNIYHQCDTSLEFSEVDIEVYANDLSQFKITWNTVEMFTRNVCIKCSYVENRDGELMTQIDITSSNFVLETSDKFNCVGVTADTI